MTDDSSISDFFDRYSRALAARDAHEVAQFYASPALMVFPGQSLPVSDRSQIEDFFASSWGASGGPDSAEGDPTTIATAEHSVWVDVTWRYGGEERERFVYQLVGSADAGWQIAVQTPLAV